MATVEIEEGRRQEKLARRAAVANMGTMGEAIAWKAWTAARAALFKAETAAGKPDFYALAERVLYGASIWLPEKHWRDSSTPADFVQFVQDLWTKHSPEPTALPKALHELAEGVFRATDILALWARAAAVADLGRATVDMARGAEPRK